LGISDCGMRSAECGMRNAECGLGNTDFGLPRPAGLALRAAFGWLSRSARLRIVDCGE
jgi:hypothetical protein